MGKPSACFIILFCTTSLLSSCGQAKVTVLSTVPLRQIPDDYGEYTDILLSPDAEFVAPVLILSPEVP